MPETACRVTRDPHVCPACRRCGPCRASELAYFDLNALGLVCAGCKHTWPVAMDTPVVPPLLEPIDRQPAA